MSFVHLIRACFKPKYFIVIVLSLFLFSTLLTLDFLGSTYSSMKFYSVFLLFSPLYFITALQRTLLISRGFLAVFLIFVVHFLFSLNGKISAFSPKESLVVIGLSVLFLSLSSELRRVSEARKWCVYFLLIVGFAAVFVGLLQYVVSFLPRFAQGGIPLLLPAGDVVRISGFFGQPNHFGLLLTIHLVVLSGKTLTRGWLENSWRLRVLASIGLIAGAAVLYLTGSRCAILGWICTFACFFFKFRSFGKRGCLKNVFLLTVLGFFVGAFLQVFGNYVGISQRLMVAGQNYSIQSRFLFWVSSLFLFFDHWLYGVGLGQFGNYLPDYAMRAHDFLGFVNYESIANTNWSHNEILQVLCEMGMFGIFIVFIALFCLFRRFYNFCQSDPDESSITFILIIPFVVHSLFSWNFRFLPLCFIFIVIASLNSLNLPRKHFWIVPKMGNLILAFVLMVGVCVGFSHENSLQKVKQAVILGSDEEGVAALESAGKSWYARPVAFSEGLPHLIDRVTKKNDILLAKRLLPLMQHQVEVRGSYADWYGLGKVYLSLRGLSDAHKAFSQAIQLQPVFEMGWNALHYTNTLLASQNTGRPHSDFIPVDVPSLEEVFSNDRRQTHQSGEQNLSK